LLVTVVHSDNSRGEEAEAEVGSKTGKIRRKVICWLEPLTSSLPLDNNSSVPQQISGGLLSEESKLGDVTEAGLS
jgi:hypothetical protein